MGSIPQNPSGHLNNKGRDELVYITGDTHGDFRRIFRFCERMGTTVNDVMVILGDAGINFFLNSKDYHMKDKIKKLNITLFCIQGNHECRPCNIRSYRVSEKFGGKVYIESAYPNIVFAEDGEVYRMESEDGTLHSVLVIGGAYSVDKPYRLDVGSPWFEDEQPSELVKQRVEEKLDSLNWEVDDIFTHTIMMDRVNPSKLMKLCDEFEEHMDKSTERWLGTIRDRMKRFNRWYFGHYHYDEADGKFTAMFESYAIL